MNATDLEALLAADPTFAALCAAIDGGDDTALPALADFLEECGDERAVGLRAVAVCRLVPCFLAHTRWAWYRAPDTHGSCGATVASAAWDRMEAAEGWSQAGRSTGGEYLTYPSCSLALLALAAALGPEDLLVKEDEMSDAEKVEAALELVRQVRRWACAAYEWENFWNDMSWRPESQAADNGRKLRDFIKEAEAIFPELAKDET